VTSNSVPSLARLRTMEKIEFDAASGVYVRYYVCTRCGLPRGPELPTAVHDLQECLDEMSRRLSQLEARVWGANY
jgi:hypothetical protein